MFLIVANRQCFESSNRELELVIRTLDPGTFNGIYMTVDITPASAPQPNPDQGQTDVGLVGGKCRLTLKVKFVSNTQAQGSDTGTE